LPRLEAVPEIDRQGFANIVYRLGYDVAVPGIEPRDPRPWR
jgi:hypothetical protein